MTLDELCTEVAGRGQRKSEDCTSPHTLSLAKRRMFEAHLGKLPDEARNATWAIVRANYQVELCCESVEWEPPNYEWPVGVMYYEWPVGVMYKEPFKRVAVVKRRRDWDTLLFEVEQDQVRYVGRMAARSRYEAEDMGNDWVVAGVQAKKLMKED